MSDATDKLSDDTSVRAAIMVHGAPLNCYEAFSRPENMTRFWFPRASGPLEPGAEVTWALGDEADALTIPVHVIEARPGECLVFDWGDPDATTQVAITFTEKGPMTEIEIVETGHAGPEDDRLTALLDSTGGFNQVVVAAKALVEHGVSVQIVRDRVP